DSSEPLISYFSPCAFCIRIFHLRICSSVYPPKLTPSQYLSFMSRIFAAVSRRFSRSSPFSACPMISRYAPFTIGTISFAYSFTTSIPSFPPPEQAVKRKNKDMTITRFKTKDLPHFFLGLFYYIRRGRSSLFGFRSRHLFNMNIQRRICLQQFIPTHLRRFGVR